MEEYKETSVVHWSGHFDASHHLPGHGKCGENHGHTYNVEIRINGDVDPNTGMVVDFGSIKKQVMQYDHCNLNSLIEFPSAEMIAKSICWDVSALFSSDWFADHIRFVEVCLSEGNAGKAIHVISPQHNLKKSLSTKFKELVTINDAREFMRLPKIPEGDVSMPQSAKDAMYSLEKMLKFYERFNEMVSNEMLSKAAFLESLSKEANSSSEKYYDKDYTPDQKV